MSNSNGTKPPSDEKEGIENNLIVFPGGSSIDPKEVGADFVVGSSGYVPTGEVLDRASVQKDLRNRIAFVKNQPLVKALVDGEPSTAMNMLLIEIAEEISHLKYERRKAAEEGRATAKYTAARVNSLKSLAETIIRRKEAAIAENLDLKSPRIQKIFKIWMQFFYEAMEKSNVSSEVINVVFQQMKADMVGWEKRMDSE